MQGLVSGGKHMQGLVSGGNIRDWSVVVTHAGTGQWW